MDSSSVMVGKSIECAIIELFRGDCEEHRVGRTQFIPNIEWLKNKRTRTYRD